MKIMKTQIKKKYGLLLAILIMIFSTNFVVAQQQGRGNGPRPLPTDAEIVEIVDTLAAELSLNEKQKGEILEMYRSHFEEVKVKRDANRAARAAHWEEMNALKTSFETNVKSKLNAEQKTKFDTFQKTNCPRRKGCQGPPKR